MLALLSVACGHAVDRLHVVFGAAAIPHPAKAAKGGEDAYFYDDRLGTFGVADGVGGSASATVDPGEFSREILSRCHAAVLDGSAPEELRFCPLDDALQSAASPPVTTGGSSTLLLGQLDADTSTLRIANLGDSGAMIMRPAFRRFRSGKKLWPRLIMRSQDQTHFFNCPYQACADDFGTVCERTDELITVVREGDIVIAATDGVLDNLFDEALQMTVAECLPALRGKDPTAVQSGLDGLAQLIAERANTVGLRQDDQELNTPFVLAAAKEGLNYPGGKLDDVAVVCGLIRGGERPQLRVGHNFGVEGVVVPTAQQEAQVPVGDGSITQS